ncbi:MAG: phosphoribosylglycinamide formyltransferase [Anaerovoracaceae bacterium]
MEKKMNISVLVSGGGTNLQAVIDKIEDGYLEDAKIVQVISSKEGAYALERAAKAGIKVKVIKDTSKLLLALETEKTDIILLAGYMRVLEPAVIQAYPKRIVNIHPSLIPKYSGKGFYGHHVHEAVIAAGEKVSGATVHFVDEGVDTGEIILQREVLVKADDTPETLAARVLKTEHEILSEGLKTVIIDMKLGGK